MKSAILYAPLFGLMACGAAAPALAQSEEFPTYQVGPQANGSYVMSTGQIITPAGTVTILGTPVRAKALALNPVNPLYAAVLEMGAPQAVQVINLATGAIVQSFSPSGLADSSFTGITFTPDGTKLLFSQDYSYIAVANVDPGTGLLSNNTLISVPPSQAYINCSGITVGLPSEPLNFICGQFYNGNSSTSNPAGIAVSADGTTAYAVLNANNTVQPIDLTVNPPVAKGNQIPVGNVPNSAVVYGSKIYVTNEGGRVAKPGDFTNYSNGTPIVANKVNGSAATGTVSVIDMNTNAVFKTIRVGLHPTGISRVGGLIYVLNTSGETISVIDAATDKVIRTINVALQFGGKSMPFGAQPTSIAVVGSTAYVTLYTMNAIAVVDLSGASASPVLGYIPTASTPTAVAYDAAHNQLVVTNDKGLGTWGKQVSAYGLVGYNSHEDTADINLIPIPTASQLQTYTMQVAQNNHWDLTANLVAAKKGNPNVAPVAIPKRLGEPSKIQHIFLLVRENRTYDQILGDVAGGNGDPALTEFGATITPNAHALVGRFPLLDNYYNPSRQSADGHNWLVQAIAPYMDDIQSPDWVRSYPANGLDAMAYQPKGFVWDAAEAKGLKVKIFGEYVEYAGYTKNNYPGNTNPSWTDYYNDALAYESGAESQLQLFTSINVISEIPSVQKALIPNFPPFDLNIPDQYRVDLWSQNFAADVASNSVPALTTIWLSDDHTGGPPTAAAEQADNDLAVGRIVDIISHSNVWSSSAIFVTEDDAQAGTDHVDGHRSPGYVISPYVVQNEGANSTYFSQVNFTRTIEQILGLPPMNQFDLVASPMYNLFINNPPAANFAAWNNVQETIPLNQGVTQGSAKLSPIARAWRQAKAEIFKGKMTKPDSEDPNLVNHMNWYEVTGYTRPYPGEKMVRLPSDFGDAIAHPHLDLD